MKRIFLALFLLSWTLGAASQNVALGEKTPDLKVKSWLDDRMPVPGRTFLLVFFHSTSRPAVESLAHLQELGRKFGDRVNVVVVVRESPEAVGGIVRPYAEGNLTVASTTAAAVSPPTTSNTCFPGCWFRPKAVRCGWEIRVN